MPSKKTVISQETIARKTIGKKGPSKDGGVAKRKRPSKEATKEAKKKPSRAGKKVSAKKSVPTKKPAVVEEAKVAEEKTKTKRRRLPGELATANMVALQTRTAKQRQWIENEAKFNRGVYTCARNINPEMRVGKDGASLIYQEGNNFISEIVSKAMCITLASSPSGRAKGGSLKRLEAKHILATLSSNPEYLAKVTPHPYVVSVPS